MSQHSLDAGNSGGGWSPQPKVAAGGVGGMAAIVVVWILSSVGLEMPEAVATAIGALITAGVAYLMPHKG
ncbi:hypothetical protein [Saccharopolyspora tripterygii]